MSGAAGESGAERRRRIVAAARRLFARDGLEATSMRRIAAEAGCTTGAIYPWFDGKQALYAAVLAETLETLGGAVERAVEGASEAAGDGRPLEAALAGLRALFVYYRERPDELALGLYLYRGLRPAGLGEALDAGLNERLLAATAPIESAFAAAGLEAPRARTAAALAQVVGLVVLARTGRLRLYGQSAERLLELQLADLAAAARR